jgi:pimeloyl-ACP methyl ester carboxylesterase
LRANYKRLGHALLGEIDSSSSSATISRSYSQVQGADISQAIGGWISGWLGAKPQDFADNIEIVEIKTNDGWSLPAWLQRANSDTWVIHVHGRGASQAETARNFAQFHALGFTNLAISYRNDGTALISHKPRRGALGLGTSEWGDLEASLSFAMQEGARHVLVFAWSYGAAISLQFAKNSALAAKVDGYIFDSPVISWRATTSLQAHLAGAPQHWVSLGEEFLKNAKKAKSIGLSSAIDFAQFEVSAIANYFETPTLILHSRDDGYIPIEPCQELADALPDTVSLVEFEGARHCKLYNYNLAKYQQAIADFVASTSN